VYGCRGITLSPRISKLFEMCILDRYGEYLWSSDLQFGFKKGIGCNHALYMIRSVVEYFTAAGSVINLCALSTIYSGVRRGVILPVLFAVYVNSLIEMLRHSGYGCYVDNLFVGCVMYADDLLLVSASIHKLQLMVDTCCSEAIKLDMKFNASKSQAIRIGKSHRTDICHICLVDELKYLGWYVVSAKCFKVSPPPFWF